MSITLPKKFKFKHKFDEDIIYEATQRDNGDCLLEWICADGTLDHVAYELNSCKEFVNNGSWKLESVDLQTLRKPSLMDAIKKFVGETQDTVMIIPNGYRVYAHRSGERLDVYSDEGLMELMEAIGVIEKALREQESHIELHGI